MTSLRISSILLIASSPLNSGHTYSSECSYGKLLTYKTGQFSVVTNTVKTQVRSQSVLIRQIRRTVHGWQN